MLDGDIGGDVSELASGERVDDNAFLSWSCCDSSKRKKQTINICSRRKWLHASVAADNAVVPVVCAAVVAGCCYRGQ